MGSGAITARRAVMACFRFATALLTPWYDTASLCFDEGIPEDETMPSPFPGMDPYLEESAHWPDFHDTFIQCARGAITSALPSHYTARIGERLYLIESNPPARRMIYLDLAVERQPGPRSTAAPAHATATLAAPATLPLPALEQPRETFIEILHRPDRSLVASLELLCPANKE